MSLGFFFFNDTATTEIYTLSLHDALPIYIKMDVAEGEEIIFSKYGGTEIKLGTDEVLILRDRKSTRLNSSHGYISYAVFCLKKKNNTTRANRECGATPSQGRPWSRRVRAW